MAYIEMYNEDVPSYGTLYAVSHFTTLVQNKVLKDYDGYGFPVKDNKMNPHCTILATQYKSIPAEATHIVWFNK